MIQPAGTFKDILQQLPPVGDMLRIDLVDAAGAVVGCVENRPGKQGALAVYNYLNQCFDILDVKAAEYGLTLFAEHTPDARENPGAHPSIDHLLRIIETGAPLRIAIIANP